MPRKTDRRWLNVALLIYNDMFRAGNINLALITRFVQRLFEDEGCALTRNTLRNYIEAEGWDRFCEIVQNRDDFEPDELMQAEEEEIYTYLDEHFEKDISVILKMTAQQTIRGLRAAQDQQPKTFDSALKRANEFINTMAALKRDPKLSPDQAKFIGHIVVQALIDVASNAEDGHFLKQLDAYLPVWERAIEQRFKEPYSIQSKRQKALAGRRADSDPLKIS